MFGRRQLNKFQSAVAKNYGDGDYAEFIETGLTKDDLDNCGDTLFKFLMVELSDEGEPMDAETAEQRMSHAVRDCEAALIQVQQATA